MPCVHEFGIIRDYSEKNISSYTKYEPKKYNCISIDDDDITPVLHKCGDIDTINPCIPEDYKGLCHYGITIVPSNSCREFAEIFKAENNPVFDEFVSLMDNAAENGYNIIHYGI